MPHSPKARVLCSHHRILNYPQVEGRQFGESGGGSCSGWLVELEYLTQEMSCTLLFQDSVFYF